MKIPMTAMIISLAQMITSMTEMSNHNAYDRLASTALWQVYDTNTRSVEGVLHAFFYDQRVKLSSKAANDNLYKETEWFNVPLNEIEKAINLVIPGDIKNYRMDGAAGKVVLK